MQLNYVVKRVGMFFFIVWLAATVNFFLPRLGGGDPVRQQLIQQAALGGSIQTGMEDMIASYDEKFGLNTPLWKQYVTYVQDMLNFDFNYSIASYPRTVLQILGQALPWTIGLLTTTILISWVLGGILGAFMGWPRSPRWLGYLMPPLLSLNAIPFFLLGLVLIYVLAFRLGWFPLSYGYQPGTSPEWSVAFIRDMLHHAVLPALSIILVSLSLIHI